MGCDGANGSASRWGSAPVTFPEMSDPTPALQGYCAAAKGHPFHGPYHDEEYGFPVTDEALLFEITGEFLTSIGYLPGAHDPNCPVYARILELDPLWARTGA